jgi:2,5-diketo-D-gluconate reductase A
VVLRWHIQRGVVAIPKSVHAERIRENFDIFDFKLSGQDMEAIRSLDEEKGLFVRHEDPLIVKQLNSWKIHE